MQLWEHLSEQEIAILKERAIQVRATESSTTEQNVVSVLIIYINEIPYAFSIDALVSVYINVPIVNIPCVPNYIKGVSNLRGHITPIIDLATLFNLPDDNSSTEKYYCVLASSESNTCAFYVQKVGNIQSINLENLSPVSDETYKREYLEGISQDDIILVNTRAILEDKTLIIDEIVE